MQISLPGPVRIATPPDLAAPLVASTTARCAAGEFRVQRLHLTEGASAGVELLVVDSGSVRAAICPTRGLGLWKAHIDGIDYGWNSPVAGPIHPRWVALQEAGGLGWLDGFDELVVRCGMRSFGAPDFDANGSLQFPLHGRVANLPARDVQVHVDAEHSLLEVVAQVHETRFLQYNLQLTAKYVFAFGQPTIEIQDRITNASSQPTTAQMLYHINVGKPILSAGAQLHLASERIVARNSHAATDIDSWQTYRAPTPGYEEQVYFSASRGDAAGWASALLASSDAARGFAVHYRADTLPFFTQWKNTVAEADGYVTGLEPGTGFPNPRTFEEEQARLLQLDGGQSVEFHLKLEGISAAGRIAQLAGELEGRRAQPIPTDDFDPNWCVPR